MNYSPNFNDPRVVSRIKKSLYWVKKYISPTKANWLSTREIDKHLGSQRNDISKYLRTMLLVCKDEVYSKQSKKCKEYCLNQEGFNFLTSKIDTQLQYSVVEVSSELKQQLDSGCFQYKDLSSRLFNPIQYIKREPRKQLLKSHGYKYEYDIECCAFTLLLQYAQRCGMDEYPIAINNYMKNRTSIRQRITEQCEIDLDTTKRIINGLLQGAIISHDPRTAFMKELGGDHLKIEWFKQDEFIQELKSDIKLMWTYIRPYMQLRTITTKSGITKRLPITSKQKTCVYRELERQVLNSVRTFLEKNSQRYFLEHDGWTSDTKLDLIELKKFVQTNTGFVIEIDSTIHD